MREGDAALASLAQADRREKLRPVVILRELPLHSDALVCGISSQLQPRTNQFDQLISPADPDFKSSGLLTTSLIRLGFLSVLPPSRIAGVIGFLSPERHRSLLETLSDYLIRPLRA